MTPEQAQDLLDAATPGPWDYDDGDGTIYAIDGGGGNPTFLFETESYGGRILPNVALAAAAPDLAQGYLDQAEKIERLDSYIDSLLDYVAPGVAENYARRILHPGDLGEATDE